MFSDVSVSGPLWRSVSDVPLQRIRINVFVCRIRISATRVHLLLPNHTGPYQLPVTLYCMWNSYHCNSLSLSLSFLSLFPLLPSSSSSSSSSSILTLSLSPFIPLCSFFLSSLLLSLLYSHCNHCIPHSLCPVPFSLSLCPPYYYAIPPSIHTTTATPLQLLCHLGHHRVPRQKYPFASFLCVCASIIKTKKQETKRKEIKRKPLVDT